VSEAPAIDTPDRRDAMRAKLLATIPGWYSPYLHLATPTLIGIGCVALAVHMVDRLTLGDVAFVSFTWMVSNMTEWRAHRDLLHKRTWPFTELYDRHTPLHHILYPGEDMAIRSTPEWRFVLIPSWGILAILIAISPFTALFLLLGWTKMAALFVATCAVYVVSYEWLHLSYHLPPDSFVGRLAMVRWLRHHHATHHRHDLMQKWNFNVSFPIWDLVRGTYYRGD
jgi:hypothetical protein